jgi:hypothetical protein
LIGQSGLAQTEAVCPKKDIIIDQLAVNRLRSPATPLNSSSLRVQDIGFVEIFFAMDRWIGL